MKKPAASVPSSGRPCCDTTDSTSGRAADQFAHLVDVGVALLQRDRRRQRGADPQIALLQLGQELEPEQAHEHDGHDDKARSAGHDDPRFATAQLSTGT